MRSVSMVVIMSEEGRGLSFSGISITQYGEAGRGRNGWRDKWRETHTYTNIRGTREKGKETEWERNRQRPVHALIFVNLLINRNHCTLIMSGNAHIYTLDASIFSLVLIMIRSINFACWCVRRGKCVRTRTTSLFLATFCALNTSEWD